MSYFSELSLTRDPLLFQKIPCPLVALVKDNAVLTSHSSLGLIYCVYPLLTRDQLVCIITHLFLLYLVLTLSNKVFIKMAKTFAEFTLLFATSVQCWHTYHKSYISCINPHYAPLRRRRGILLCTYRSVGMSVCRSVGMSVGRYVGSP